MLHAMNTTFPSPCNILDYQTGKIILEDFQSKEIDIEIYQVIVL